MTEEERVEACAAQLLATCREANVWVSGDSRVNVDTAADLLNMAAGTLKNWRSSGNGPRFYKVGGRATYKLTDLAQFIESSRES